MTLSAMVNSMSTFTITICLYIVTVLPIYLYIFQTETIVAANNFYMIRFMFDSMVGSFGNIGGDLALAWQVITLINVFLVHVFLLNYLIAILSTVYQQKEEEGDFAYKQNKYQYIERYSIAMEDPSYAELVVHPPPINYLMLLLFPSMCQKQKMKQTS